jgi:hypothetical protein
MHLFGCEFVFFVSAATKSRVAKGRADGLAGGRAAFSQNKWKRIWRSRTAGKKWKSPRAH